MDVKGPCSKWTPPGGTKANWAWIAWFIPCHHPWRFADRMSPTDWPKISSPFVWIKVGIQPRQNKTEEYIKQKPGQLRGYLGGKAACRESMRNWVQIPSTHVKPGHGSTGLNSLAVEKAGQMLCLNGVGMKRTHEVEFWLPHPPIQGANKEIYLKFLSLFLFFFQKKKKIGKPGQLPNQFQAWDGGWWTNGQLW